MKRFFLSFLTLLFFSCNSSVVKFPDLHTYKGIYNIVEDPEGNFAFLTNLKDYNNIMALCYISESGELTEVMPVNKYDNVDVSSDFITLVTDKNYLYLFYDNRGSELIMETYINRELVLRTAYPTASNTSGSIIAVGNNSYYVKSSTLKESGRNYIYNCFRLTDSNLIEEVGRADLGELFPSNLIMLNNNIYYTTDKEFHRKKLGESHSIPLYKFEEDVVDIGVDDKLIYILLKKSVFIFDSEDDTLREINLNSDNPGAWGISLFFPENRKVTVSMISDTHSYFKVISPLSREQEVYHFDFEILGEFYYKNGILLYSTRKGLFLKSL